MALEHGDLFFINRSGSTYKIEAVELGNYLTDNPLNDGTYIVNDGLLSLSNKGNDALEPFVITSANSPLNSVIEFDENFIVRSVGGDASITLNYEHVSSTILCTDKHGNTPGFLEENCGCIEFDWDYFANRLPCPDRGIINNNGCLSINLCDDGALGFYPSGVDKEACLDVNLCGGSGVINTGGCLDLDYALIANNLVCDTSNSGLNNNPGDSCITVNFEKVMAEMGLGVLQSSDNSILFTPNTLVNGSDSGDLTRGHVDLKVNPLVVQDTKINKIRASGSCLSIDGNDDLTQGDVIINLSKSCIQNLTGGGGGGNIVINEILAGDGIKVTGSNGDLSSGDVTVAARVCNNGGIEFGTNGCLKLAITDEDTGCMSDPDHTFIAERLYTAESGGGNDPSVVFGVKTSANNPTKWWCGLAANQNNGAMQFITGRGWDNYEDCGGEIPKDDTELSSTGSYGVFFSAAVGYNVMPNFKVTGLIGSHGDTVVAFIDAGGGRKLYEDGNNCNNKSKKYDSLPAMQPDGAGLGCKVDNDDQKRRPDGDQLDKLNVFGFAEGKYDMYLTGNDGTNGKPDDRVGRRNRLGFDANSHSTGRFAELTSDDTRIGFGATEEARVTFIENVMDQMGTLHSEGGLMRFALKKNDGMPEYPHMYMDANSLAQIAPSLVEYDWGPGSTYEVFDDEGRHIGENYVDNLEDIGVVAVKPHYRSLTMLSLVAHKIRKKQVQDLQARVDSLEARLTAAGIP